MFSFLQPPTVSGFRTLIFVCKKKLLLNRSFFLNGSERGVRTPDTRIMIPLLYRLSYPAVKFMSLIIFLFFLVNIYF